MTKNLNSPDLQIIPSSWPSNKIRTLIKYRSRNFHWEPLHSCSYNFSEVTCTIWFLNRHKYGRFVVQWYLDQLTVFAIICKHWYLSTPYCNTLNSNWPNSEQHNAVQREPSTNWAFPTLQFDRFYLLVPAFQILYQQYTFPSLTQVERNLVSNDGYKMGISKGSHQMGLDCSYDCHFNYAQLICILQ